MAFTAMLFALLVSLFLFPTQKTCPLCINPADYVQQEPVSTLPHIVYINGHRWAIVEVPKIWQCSCDGYTEDKTKQILLERNMRLHKQQAILLHELSHASLIEFGDSADHQNLPWQFSEHDTFGRLAPAMADTLRSNVNLLEYFAQDQEP